MNQDAGKGFGGLFSAFECSSDAWAPDDDRQIDRGHLKASGAWLLNLS